MNPLFFKGDIMATKTAAAEKPKAEKKEVVTFLGTGIVNWPGTAKEMAKFAYPEVWSNKENQMVARLRDAEGYTNPGEFKTDDAEIIKTMRAQGYKEK